MDRNSRSSGGVGERRRGRRMSAGSLSALRRLNPFPLASPLQLRRRRRRRRGRNRSNSISISSSSSSSGRRSINGGNGNNNGNDNSPTVHTDEDTLAADVNTATIATAVTGTATTKSNHHHDLTTTKVRNVRDHATVGRSDDSDTWEEPWEEASAATAAPPSPGMEESLSANCGRLSNEDGVTNADATLEAQYQRYASLNAPLATATNIGGGGVGGGGGEGVRLQQLTNSTRPLQQRPSSTSQFSQRPSSWNLSNFDEDVVFQRAIRAQQGLFSASSSTTGGGSQFHRAVPAPTLEPSDDGDAGMVDVGILAQPSVDPTGQDPGRTDTTQSAVPTPVSTAGSSSHGGDDQNDVDDYGEDDYGDDDYGEDYGDDDYGEDYGDDDYGDDDFGGDYGGDYDNEHTAAPPVEAVVKGSKDGNMVHAADGPPTPYPAASSKADVAVRPRRQKKDKDSKSSKSNNDSWLPLVLDPNDYNWPPPVLDSAAASSRNHEKTATAMTMTTATGQPPSNSSLPPTPGVQQKKPRNDAVPATTSTTNNSNSNKNEADKDDDDDDDDTEDDEEKEVDDDVASERAMHRHPTINAGTSHPAATTRGSAAAASATTTTSQRRPNATNSAGPSSNRGGRVNSDSAAEHGVSSIDGSTSSSSGTGTSQHPSTRGRSAKNKSNNGNRRRQLLDVSWLQPENLPRQDQDGGYIQDDSVEDDRNEDVGGATQAGGHGHDDDDDVVGAGGDGDDDDDSVDTLDVLTEEQMQRLTRQELIDKLLLLQRERHRVREEYDRRREENLRLYHVLENPLYKEELNGREEADIREVFEKIMAPYENGTTRRNDGDPRFFQYDYDAVCLNVIKEAFGVHSRYHALHLPKVVAIGLVRNLYDFGLFCKLEKMDHWKRIKQSNTFLCLQSAKIGENAAATNSGLIDPQGHRHPASCLCRNNGMSKETAATVIMVVLDIAGFADFTINADGTDNGRRLRNSRSKQSWLTINPADSDECVDRQILTEGDCRLMYSDYENRPNLTWAGKDDGEGGGDDDVSESDFGSDSDNGQN